MTSPPPGGLVTTPPPGELATSPRTSGRALALVAAAVLAGSGALKLAAPDPAGWIPPVAARAIGAAETILACGLIARPGSAALWWCVVLFALAGIEALAAAWAAGVPLERCGCFGAVSQFQSPSLHAATLGTLLLAAAVALRTSDSSSAPPRIDLTA